MKYKKQVYLGYDSKGKQIRKWFYGETKAELKLNIERYKEEARKLKNPSDVTFKEYSAQWKRVYKSNRAKQTVDMYDNALKKCGDIDPVPITHFRLFDFSAISSSSGAFCFTSISSKGCVN